MMDDQDGNHIDTLKKQIRLIIRSIANCDETKILDLMNSRTELSFQLRLTLLELRNDRTLSQDDERSSRYVRSLLEVLRGLVSERKDHHLKTEDPHQAALARISCDEADSPEPSLVRLPQTAEELRAAAQKISNLRKLNSSRHDVQSDPERGRDYTNPHHRTTTRDGSHLNEVDKSEGENECHNFNESEVEPPRNGRDPSFSVSLGCKSPATAEFQNIIPKELLDQLRDKQTAAGEFMRSAKTFHEEKIIPLKSNKLIKVAVLDTGVDKGEPYFMRGVSGTSIKDAKSFIDDSPHDIDGHGTRVAALVKAIAPHVDLYIAKVCHEHKTVVEDQYAKAINWAMEHNVHIINISASIDETESVCDAIEKAEARGIIIFAAASNSGANMPRAFPAAMDKVLAIHATDGRGNPSNMNACPVKQSMNFSTLGEGISLPLHRGKLFPPGTSYSAAIATGMAANVLILVEECLGKLEEDKLRRRRGLKREGMKRIFFQASQLQGGYDYVCPNWLVKGKTDVTGFRHWLMDALDQ